MAEQNNNRCARTVKTDTSTHAGHTTHSELSESNDPADSLALMLPIAATGMHTATHTEVGVPKSTCDAHAKAVRKTARKRATQGKTNTAL